MKVNGPDFVQEQAGHFTAGLTEAQQSYDSNFTDWGSYCELDSANIRLNLVVTLPEHPQLAVLSGEMLSRWREYASRVAAHEQTHVDIHIQRIEAFKHKLEQLPPQFASCEALTSAIQKAWEAEDLLNEQDQDAFHRAEELLSQSLRQPFEAQIEANKREMAGLQARIDSVSADADKLRLQIEDWDVEMRPYRIRMEAIQEEYPDLVLPADRFDEYEELLGEWNRLNDVRSEIVAELNSLVGQHNKAVADSNLLNEQTNALIEESNWLP